VLAKTSRRRLVEGMLQPYAASYIEHPVETDWLMLLKKFFYSENHMEQTNILWGQNTGFKR
jgi:hypothetical protein